MYNLIQSHKKASINACIRNICKTSHNLVPDPANTKTIETTAETIELKGLKAATTYKVKVAALNGAGAGPLSSPIEELVDTHICPSK